jgi:hypothetical protein
MSKNYSGAKEQMRDTDIMSEEVYLGTHSPILGVSDVQSRCLRLMTVALGICHQIIKTCKNIIESQEKARSQKNKEDVSWQTQR